MSNQQNDQLNDEQNQESTSTGHQDEEQEHVEHHQDIDNSAKLLEKIANLYAERLLSDIILDVNGKRYPAHRLILCASSDVFQVMLMNPNWSESQESVIALQEEIGCQRVFADFLKYLYTGMIYIDHKLVLPLVSLADKYNVRDLVSLCVDYMRVHIVSATKHNHLVSWLHYMLNCGHNDITQACMNYVAWNFEAVAAMSDFIALESDILITFLKKSDLVVKDEYTLFQIAIKWLEGQESKLKLCGDEFFDSMVCYVMSQIRFPLMSPRQLANLVLFPIVTRYSSYFLAQMNQAMQYHNRRMIFNASNTNQSQEKYSSCTSVNSYLFTPRLYTTETWSSSLVIENFKHLPVYGVRTLVFNTPSSLADWEQSLADKMSLGETTDSICCSNWHEWVVEVYPKGVWFKKSYCIRFSGSLEVPEWVCKTVRLSLSPSKNLPDRKVSIGILILGKVDGIEHIYKVIQKDFMFTKEDKLLNIDDLIPFDDLNQTVNPIGDANAIPTVDNNNSSKQSHFLVGQENDTLKVQIVITPLHKV